jgi:hypothetical protein
MSLTSHLGLIVCCALTAGIIGGTVSWMENNAPPLSADDALAQATRTARQYCTRQGVSPCGLKLVNATAPATWLSMTQAKNDTPQWEFEFYSPRQGFLEVKVPVTGQQGTTTRQHF